MRMKNDILSYIPIGSRNAVPRSTLRVRVNLSDRTVRSLIEESNQKSPWTPIINTQDGKGYFVPDPNNHEDLMELKKYVKQQQNRISNIAKTTKGARNLVKMYGREKDAI